jgi:acyl-coenzyme A synthetase/AMP-(fatty) acid ligase
VVETVVVWDGAIDAYVVLDEGTTAAEVEDRLAVLIAPFKRPQNLHRLAALPRTATGKRVRDLGALRAAAALSLLPDH